MRRRLACGPLLISLAVGALPSLLLPARASAAAASKSERVTARRLVAEGDGCFARKDYAQALERYAEAYRVMHVPTVGVEVVKAQKALGKLVEAAQTAREVAALPEQAHEPVVFSQARQQAEQEIVTLSGMTPSLLVDVAPRGVLFTVQIDGVSPVGETPFPVNPGQHHVRVSADGYQNADQDVTLQDAARQTLSVRLLPDAAPASAAPPASGAASSGVASSGVASSGVASSGVASSGVASSGVEKAASPPAPAAVRPAHGSSGRTLGWVGIGVAGVGVAAGSFAGIDALQTKPDCPNHVCSPSQRKDIHNSKTLGTIADVSFGLAIVAGALGIWALAASSAGEDGESAALPATEPLAGAAERAGALHVTALDLGTGPFELRLSGSF